MTKTERLVYLLSEMEPEIDSLPGRGPVLLKALARELVELESEMEERLSTMERLFSRLKHLDKEEYCDKCYSKIKYEHTGL